MTDPLLPGGFDPSFNAIDGLLPPGHAIEAVEAFVGAGGEPGVDSTRWVLVFYQEAD